MKEEFFLSSSHLLFPPTDCFMGNQRRKRLPATYCILVFIFFCPDYHLAAQRVSRRAATHKFGSDSNEKGHLTTEAGREATDGGFLTDRKASFLLHKYCSTVQVRFVQTVSTSKSNKSPKVGKFPCSTQVQKCCHKFNKSQKIALYLYLRLVTLFVGGGGGGWRRRKREKNHLLLVLGRGGVVQPNPSGRFLPSLIFSCV